LFRPASIVGNRGTDCIQNPSVQSATGHYIT